MNQQQHVRQLPAQPQPPHQQRGNVTPRPNNNPNHQQQQQQLHHPNSSGVHTAMPRPQQHPPTPGIPRSQQPQPMPHRAPISSSDVRSVAGIMTKQSITNNSKPLDGGSPERDIANGLRSILIRHKVEVVGIQQKQSTHNSSTSGLVNNISDKTKPQTTSTDSQMVQLLPSEPPPIISQSSMDITMENSTITTNTLPNPSINNEPPPTTPVAIYQESPTLTKLEIPDSTLSEKQKVIEPSSINNPIHTNYTSITPTKLPPSSPPKKRPNQPPYNPAAPMKMVKFESKPADTPEKLTTPPSSKNPLHSGSEDQQKKIDAIKRQKEQELSKITTDVVMKEPDSSVLKTSNTKMEVSKPPSPTPSTKPSKKQNADGTDRETGQRKLQRKDSSQENVGKAKPDTSSSVLKVNNNTTWSKTGEIIHSRTRKELEKQIRDKDDIHAQTFRALNTPNEVYCFGERHIIEEEMEKLYASIKDEKSPGRADYVNEFKELLKKPKTKKSDARDSDQEGDDDDEEENSIEDKMNIITSIESMNDFIRQVKDLNIELDPEMNREGLTISKSMDDDPALHSRLTNTTDEMVSNQKLMEDLKQSSYYATSCIPEWKELKSLVESINRLCYETDTTTTYGLIEIDMSIVMRALFVGKNMDYIIIRYFLDTDDTCNVPETNTPEMTIIKYLSDPKNLEGFTSIWARVTGCQIVCEYFFDAFIYIKKLILDGKFVSPESIKPLRPDSKKKQTQHYSDRLRNDPLYQVGANDIDNPEVGKRKKGKKNENEDESDDDDEDDRSEDESDDEDDDDDDDDDEDDENGKEDEEAEFVPNSKEEEDDADSDGEGKSEKILANESGKRVHLAEEENEGEVIELNKDEEEEEEEDEGESDKAVSDDVEEEDEAVTQNQEDAMNVDND